MNPALPWPCSRSSPTSRGLAELDEEEARGAPAGGLRPGDGFSA
jgi:hypothetical protein